MAEQDQHVVDGRAPVPGRPSREDVVVAGAALLYTALGLLPWTSRPGDLLGPLAASGFGTSVLVRAAAVLLVGAAAWALLPAVRRLPAGVPRRDITLGLVALPALLTLVTWLRSTDHGLQPVPLLALLVTVAAAAAAARSLLAELRDPGSRPVRPPKPPAAPDEPPPAHR